MKLRPRSVLPVLGLLVGLAAALYAIALLFGAAWALLVGGLLLAVFCLVAEL